MCWKRTGDGPGVRVGATFSERICQIGDHGLAGWQAGKCIEKFFLGRSALPGKHFPQSALPGFAQGKRAEPWIASRFVAAEFSGQNTLSPAQDRFMSYECSLPGQAETEHLNGIFRKICSCLHRLADLGHHTRHLTFLFIHKRSFPPDPSRRPTEVEHSAVIWGEPHPGNKVHCVTSGELLFLPNCISVSFQGVRLGALNART